MDWLVFTKFFMAAMAAVFMIVVIIMVLRDFLWSPKKLAPLPKLDPGPRDKTDAEVFNEKIAALERNIKEQHATCTRIEFDLKSMDDKMKSIFREHDERLYNIAEKAKTAEQLAHSAKMDAMKPREITLRLRVGKKKDPIKSKIIADVKKALKDSGV